MSCRGVQENIDKVENDECVDDVGDDDNEYSASQSAVLKLCFR